jgi:hypothetical protein
MGSTLNLSKINEELARRARMLKGAVAKVGFPYGKTYPDGTPVAYVAAIQEFGADVPEHEVHAKNAQALAIPVTGGGTVFRKSASIPAMTIPSRSFMRSTRTEKLKEWAGLMAEGAKAVMERRISLYDMLDAVGQTAAMDVVQTIANRVSPPLAQSTVESRIRRAQRANPRFGKKSMPVTISQPLNDSGTLIAHISYGIGKVGEDFTDGKAVKP